MTVINDIRSVFLDYFSHNGHEIVPSGSLIPCNDPTLIFTNSGMVSFKDVFTGVETRSYTRAATIQKCVRAGGKHNDLDNIGYTTRHHTFFEMMGNFSFGDYFKDVAIELAWNMLTKEFCIPVDRLMVSIYAEDEEAYDLWKNISSLPDSKIIRIASSDNLWSMGNTGPCGPCSEIFFDHGEHLSGGPPGSSGQDGDRFVEIWNLVFMQFEQVDAATRMPLPCPSIDTGMGLERIAAVLQGTHDNYAIDLFHSLISASVELTGVASDGDHAISHRVISDHLRSSCFLIADGVLPSNEGHGYVLRRIMRRAMRHVHMLGVKDELMWRLVPTLVSEMGQAYPELCSAEALITEVLKLEENRFHHTLARGLSILQDEISELNADDVMDGAVAFKLYDTYGFPIDLTEDVLKDRMIKMDKIGFDAAMKSQRDMARKSWVGAGGSPAEKLWGTIYERVGKTHFSGYVITQNQGVVTALVRDMLEVDALQAGEEGFVICDQTPFYAESGGQVGDRGKIFSNDVEVLVDDTQKKISDMFVHKVTVIRGVLKIGQLMELVVDHDRRDATSVHHSAAHLLHQALKDVLGKHVTQKGSLVEPGRLRFDFNHDKGVSPEEIMRIEEIVNMLILRNSKVETSLMSVDNAIAAGATALFGEKYGDEVRVVSMEQDVDEIGVEHVYSMEICGGTHVKKTGQTGLIIIVSEGSVAAGIRRVEVLAGAAAQSYALQNHRMIKNIGLMLRTVPVDIEKRIETLMCERKTMQHELKDMRRRLALSESQSMSSDVTVVGIGSISMVTNVLKGIPAKELRNIVEDAKRKIDSGIVVFVGLGKSGQAGIVVGITDDLKMQFDAVELVRFGASVLGGQGGGGNSGLAQSGGPDGAQADAALNAVCEEIRRRMS